MADLSKLIGTLSKKQLVELLFSAAANDPSTLTEVLRVVDEEPSRRCLLVTSPESVLKDSSLRSIFSPFGEIQHVCSLGRDRFVLFHRVASAKNALKQPGMPVIFSLASPARTIHVKNLPPNFNGFWTLREFLEQFGEIEDKNIRVNMEQTPPDVSIVYKTLDGAVRALEEPRKIFDGIVIVCEKEELDRRILQPQQASTSAPPPPPPPARDWRRRSSIATVDLSELLGTLSKKQLAELLLSAAANNLSTHTEVLRVVDEEPSRRYLFITSPDVVLTEDSLHSIFSPFGKIQGVRGVGRYGSVLFCHLASAKDALEQPGMPVICSLSSTARAVHVKNLPPNFDGFAKLREFFEQFGDITDVNHIGQPHTVVRVVYKTLEGAVRAFEEPRKIFDGIVIECEKEEPDRRILPLQPAASTRT